MAGTAMITNDLCTYSIKILRQEKPFVIMVIRAARKVVSGEGRAGGAESSRTTWSPTPTGRPLGRGQRALDPHGQGPSRQGV
jgi:hypothetical protein